LFSFVLGFSRLIWARFVLHQTCNRFCVATWRFLRRLAVLPAGSSTTA
jgi:hypothetical protein